jgi:putative transposase
MPQETGVGARPANMLQETGGGARPAGESPTGERIDVEAAPTPPDKMISRRFRPILPGATYFITSVAHERRRWFANPVFAQIIVEQLKYYEKAYEFQLPAYAVMPDHYHAVVTVGEKKDISQILHAVHSYTASLINRELGNREKVKIWQGKAWDVVARDDDTYWRSIAYTLLNPWREGLVSDPLQAYSFSNVMQWREREGDEFVLDLFAQISDWREFHE